MSLRPGALELLGKPVQLAVFLGNLALKVALALHFELQFLHLLLQLGNLRQRLFLFLQVAHLLGLLYFLQLCLVHALLCLAALCLLI